MRTTIPTGDEAINEANIGYSLDFGGYSFERPVDGPLAELGSVLVWDDPDLDYFLGSDIVPPEHRGSSLMLAFALNSGHSPATVFPETLPDDDDDDYHYVKAVEGHVNETDHDCNCHGKLDLWTGAAGEPSEPLAPEKVRAWVFGDVHARIWKETAAEAFSEPERFRISIALVDVGETVMMPALHFVCTGNVSDPAYPDCDRCDGDGYVNSPGGEWALYVVEDLPTEEDEDEAAVAVRCINDSYANSSDPYDSVEEFLTMCREVHGQEPDLYEREEGHWYVWVLPTWWEGDADWQDARARGEGSASLVLVPNDTEED